MRRRTVVLVAAGAVVAGWRVRRHLAARDGSEHSEEQEWAAWAADLGKTYANLERDLARETWRLIASETLDPDHLDDLAAENVDPHDRRLALIIQRRRAELTQLHAAARACIGCGCTDDRACDPPCSWAQLDPPVCTACEGRSTIYHHRTRQLGKTRALLLAEARAASVPDPTVALQAAMDQALAEARSRVLEQGGDPDEWTFRVDTTAPLDRIVILAEPPCPTCQGPGGIYGCDVHRPRRTISDRPQA